MLRRFLSGGIFRAARRSAGSGQRFSAVSRYARNAGVHSCDRGGSIARKSSVVGKPFGAIRSPRVPSVNGCRRMDYAPGCSVVGDAGLRLINFVGRNFKQSFPALPYARRVNGLLRRHTVCDRCDCASRLVFCASHYSSGLSFVRSRILSTGTDTRRYGCGCAGGRRKGHVSFFE